MLAAGVGVGALVGWGAGSAALGALAGAVVGIPAATDDPEARYELAKLLLENGADPNARQQDDYTPLMEADQHGDERLRDLLIEHGAETPPAAR